MLMHSSVFLLLGFTIYSSAQLVDLPAEDPSTAVLQIASTNNAEVGFDSTDDGVGSSDFRSGSPEALLMSQTDDTQLCFSNGNNQRPPKRRLRARQSCRNNQDEIAPNDPPATDNTPPASALQEGEPKEGSAAGGNLDQPSAEQDWIGRPRTSKPPELPPIPGRTPSFQKNDPDPCNGERSYAVCSPLEPTTTWFPLSLIWATGSLEYCRLYHPAIPCNKEAGENLYCCRELQNKYPSRRGTSRAMLQFRARYQKSGTDCERLR